MSLRYFAQALKDVLARACQGMRPLTPALVPVPRPPAARLRKACLVGAAIALVWPSPAHADSAREAVARRHAQNAATAPTRPGLSLATMEAIARRHSGAVLVSPAIRRLAEQTPPQIWASLLDGNHRFVQGSGQRRDLVSLRPTLVQGQHPQAIVLGCSDSRVSPELVFDEGLGDLFVVRSAGNVADAIAIGSIEYAVEHLHARLLVVLGHQKCGAVAAAASGEKMPTPNLEAVVRQIRPALEPLRARGSGEALVSLGVAANVERSARQLLARSPLLAGEVEAGRLALVKAVYHLDTGEVVALP